MDACKFKVTTGADVLSDVLASYRSERAVTARFSLTAPWALHSDGVEGVLIRTCTGAPYWIAMDDGASVLLGPHDIAMLLHGSPHTVSSAPHLSPRPFRDLLATHMVGAHGEHPIVFSHGDGGAPTELFSLHLWMPSLGGGSLLEGLPSLIVLRQKNIETTTSLALAMQSLVNETISQRSGWQLTASRMADLLLVHVLREHLANDGQVNAGHLRGLDDEGIGRVMALIHQRPSEPWSVDRLAKISHLSRTVFCDRFRSLVGTTPMNYLASHRMSLAAQTLSTRSVSIPAVAQAVGYESEKAFARAFQRWSGMSPSSFSREHRKTPITH